MKTLVVLVCLAVLSGCGGVSSPMAVRTRAPDASKTQSEINQDMIDAARQRERMSARGV